MEPEILIFEDWQGTGVFNSKSVDFKIYKWPKYNLPTKERYNNTKERLNRKSANGLLVLNIFKSLSLISLNTDKIHIACAPTESFFVDSLYITCADVHFFS